MRGKISNFGFFSNLFLIWMFPVLSDFKTHPPDPNNLHKIDDKKELEKLQIKFQKKWEKEQQKPYPNLFATILSLFLTSFVFITFEYILSVYATLGMIVTIFFFLRDFYENDKDISFGIILGVAFVVLFLINKIFSINTNLQMFNITDHKQNIKAAHIFSC